MASCRFIALSPFVVGFCPGVVFNGGSLFYSIVLPLADSASGSLLLVNIMYSACFIALFPVVGGFCLCSLLVINAGFCLFYSIVPLLSILPLGYY
jgi:hypothetical protein